MAVDNLPCELPKDASEDFGSNLLERILPLVINEDKDDESEEWPAFLLIIAAGSAVGAMVLGGMILFGNKED